MPVPKDLFEQVCDLAGVFNTLVEVVASRPEALKGTLALAAANDAFTKRLVDIYNEVLSGPRPWVARRSLAVNRSDYMFDEATRSLLQVELNTISSSFGAQSTLMAEMHEQVLSKFRSLQHKVEIDPLSVPYHDTVGDIVGAFAAAVGEYSERRSRESESESLPYDSGRSVVLMVVQDDERNILDQQILEQALWKKHKVKIIRRTLAEIQEQGSLNEANGVLTLSGNIEVAVTYLRAGYSPLDYKTEVEWGARLMLEQSQAYKCPSIAYQLVGSKKIQQYLAEESVLEEFLNSREDCEKLRRCFANLWGLDDLGDGKTKEVVAHAKQNPHLYVLKPQREGGGNNLYDEELRRALEEEGDLSAYILMQRIVSPIYRSYLLRNGECTEAETLSELGIYGISLFDDGREIINKCSGALVRTKLASSNEGGVTAGYSCLSTPYLY
jgi:glutathione synthase